MLVRICPSGHQVPQENLKACPKCGLTLTDAETVEVAAPAAASAPERAVDDEVLPDVPAALGELPAGLVFLVPGVVLGLIGWLVASASGGDGTAFGGGIVLLALAGILTSIGVIAIGVRVGVHDARRA